MCRSCLLQSVLLCSHSGLKLKGYSWDVTNGGKSPTDAELAPATNWDKAVAENKHTLGTLAIADANQ